MHTRKIALLGFGTVGQGLWQLLHTNRAAIQRSVGAAVEVARILVRDFGKARAVTAPTDLFTTDFADILATPDVAVVVEMMGGIEPANSYIRQALQSGKHVVTANKALMASHGAELVALATKAGVSLRYEAAVCAAIPIVNVLQSSLAAERITSLAGILNGTSNYILSQMSDQGVSYTEALRQAQQLGYAEADPSFDVLGLDARHKLCILTRLAYGVNVPPDAIYCVGITDIKPEDVHYANDQGLCIKLLAVARRVDEQLELRVTPALIPADHALAKVGDVGNAIMVQGEAVGELLFTGPGAGGLPTGSAVLSDVVAVLSQAEQPMNKGSVVETTAAPSDLIDEGNQPADWYLRLQWSSPATLSDQLLVALQQQGIAGLEPTVTSADGQGLLQMRIANVTRVQLEQALAAVAASLEIPVHYQLIRIADL